MVLVQFLENEIALIGIPGLMQGGKLTARCAPMTVTVDQRRQMLAIQSGDHRIHDHYPFDYIAQFAHVARPGITHQSVDGVVGDFAGAASVGRGQVFQKMPCQHWNVFLPVAQRRYEERNHVEPVEEVFAEVSNGDFFFQIFISGSNDARIHGNGFLAA